MFERKNKIVKEMAITLLLSVGLPNTFWKEDVHTTIYTLNIVQLRVKTHCTPYELWFGKSFNVGYFKIFGSKCFIKRNEEILGSFKSRNDEGIFLGYSTHSKAYRCFNKRLNKIV